VRGDPNITAYEKRAEHFFTLCHMLELE